jgi:hypothetical protein
MSFVGWAEYNEAQRSKPMADVLGFAVLCPTYGPC